MNPDTTKETKKTRGRPRKEYQLPDDVKDDPVMKTMYKHWMALSRAKAAYYQRNKERILQDIKTKNSNKSTTEN
jgi:hypothetical protein